MLSTADAGFLTLPPIFQAHFYIYFCELDQKISPFYFLLVFSWTLWVGIGGIVSVTLLMLVLTKFIYKLSWSEFVEYVYEIFGFHENSNNQSRLSMKFLRLIVLVWMFLMAAVFSSFLVAQLAIIEREMPFNSLGELLQQDKYSLCVSQITVEAQILEGLEYKTGSVNGENCKKVDMGNFGQKVHEILCERSDLAFVLNPYTLRDIVAAKGLYS